MTSPSLASEVSREGLITMATPFDEPSVAMCRELDIEILKVASCSATDWPLLEQVADANKPVVFSTGGLSAKQIDDLVSLFEHRRTSFAIMHCVSIYPTPDQHFQLNQIDFLCRRYPKRWSDSRLTNGRMTPIPCWWRSRRAPRMLERHVGIATEQIALNAYSSTPEQIDAWIKAATKARTLCGSLSRPPAPAVETEALESLRRGVYARRPLKAGVEMAAADVYFAMPFAPGQLSSGEFKAGVRCGSRCSRTHPS